MFWIFLKSFKSPFLGFRFIQTGYWPDFNLESVFFYFCYKKYISFEKSDRFPVETRVDPRLYPYGRLSLFNHLNRLLFEDEKYSICASVF